NFFIDNKTQFINGIQLSINHIKSKREGMVFATARNLHKGRTTHLWEVRIVDEEDHLISIAKMTNIVLNSIKK
ncbi:hotdog fold thioesterase, partial [Polaribacter sp.]|nr:hotdog fold thioesterase [Polaribacter sp.]